MKTIILVISKVVWRNRKKKFNKKTITILKSDTKFLKWLLAAAADIIFSKLLQ
uniref:Uncharacterized protein n=1 Tax=Rhizophagus irregularis (strain DAOM 181602 / DAOM 197198 / MUCL 43194) TaxID=747089 RepID=U9SRD7_RHIID